MTTIHRRLGRLVALACMASIAVACAGGGAPTAPTSSASAAASATESATASAASAPTPAGPLATVEQRGGECPAATCSTTTSLERDGRIHVAAKPPNDVGMATPQQIAVLEAAIAATDFAALRKPAFSGECPTAYDGQELVFTFATATGTERLASCETALNLGDPLFVAFAAALGAASPFRVP